MSNFLVFGGGGHVALKFAKAAAVAGHSITSVVRNDSHDEDIKAAGGTPLMKSLESSSVLDIVELINDIKPKCVIFSAGSGGKGGPERTRAVDYDGKWLASGAVKVFDAMEASNTHRIVIVSATDLRDTSKAAPSYYNDESKRMSEQMWGAIPAYMKAKKEADENLRARKALKWTIIRPGGLTHEPSGGCELGRPQLGKVSRETVGKVLLAVAEDPRTEGMTLDLMDGEHQIGEALDIAVEQKLDSWHE